MNTPENPTPNPNTIPTPEENLAPGAVEVPPIVPPTDQAPTVDPQPVPEVQTDIPEELVAPAPPVVPVAPAKQLPSPKWFWYGLSAATWIVGIVLTVIYVSRSDKESKKFGWINFGWSFLILVVITAIILFNYFILDPASV